MSIRSLFTNLGVSDETLTKAVLGELGLSREEAVRSLADKLGVEYKEVESFNSQPAEEAAAIKTGDRVATAQGEAVAVVLPGLSIETINQVAKELGNLSL